MNELRHLETQGQAHMVSGRIEMQDATLALIEQGTAEKGDVLGIARIAAIQRA